MFDYNDFNTGQKYKKKARCSFAARRFPVYNLMKSGKFVYQSSPSFSLVALLFLIDDTKVRQFRSPAKGKKSILLKSKKAILIAKTKRESKKCAILLFNGTFFEFKKYVC